MANSVHLPSQLLERIDRRARELGLRRNRYIVRALEKAVEMETGWSPTLRAVLADAAADEEGQQAVDEVMRQIAARRTRKRAPSLIPPAPRPKRRSSSTRTPCPSS